MSENGKVFDWGEVLGSDTDSEGPDLVALREIEGVTDIKIPTGFVGITLNYPRTKRFLNANSNAQKHIYNLWFRSFKNTFDILDSHEFEFHYEYCKTGQIHLHGFIPIYQKEFFINGLLSDLAKAALQYLPAKYQNFNENCLFPDCFRYRCPSMCLQYYENNDDVEGKAGFKHWKNYIRKSQPQK